MKLLTADLSKVDADAATTEAARRPLMIYAAAIAALIVLLQVGSMTFGGAKEYTQAQEIVAAKNDLAGTAAPYLDHLDALLDPASATDGLNPSSLSDLTDTLVPEQIRSRAALASWRRAAESWTLPSTDAEAIEAGVPTRALVDDFTDSFTAHLDASDRVTDDLVACSMAAKQASFSGGSQQCLETASEGASHREEYVRTREEAARAEAAMSGSELGTTSSGTDAAPDPLP